MKIATWNTELPTRRKSRTFEQVKKMGHQRGSLEHTPILNQLSKSLT